MKYTPPIEMTSWFARHAFYALLILIAFGAVWLDSRGGNTPSPPTDPNGQLMAETMTERIGRLEQIGKFTEDGLVENLQLAALGTLILGCAWLALRTPAMRSFWLVTGGVLGLALIREMDRLLDQVVHGFWKAPAGLLALVLLVVVWRRWPFIWRGFRQLVHIPAWGFWMAGALTVVIFSRLMGQKLLWNYLIEDPQVARHLKNMVEESLELLGYTLAVCGLIEGFFNLRSPSQNCVAKKG